ncbi:MAG TPA: potassium transporter TrkG [Phycisphaerae bacterium]|nr:potassium transporter TrkG [Phycisphaerae bacterium]
MTNDASQPGNRRADGAARLNLAAAVVSVAAFAALAGHYGFRPAGVAATVLLTVQALALAAFLLLAAWRLRGSSDAWACLRNHWYELALGVATIVALLVAASADEPRRGVLLKTVCHVALVLFLVVRATELLRAATSSRFRPAQLFVSSFLVLILLGTGLLMLPEATSHEVTIRDPQGGPERHLRGNVFAKDRSMFVVQSGAGNEQVHYMRLSHTKAPPAEFTTALFTATSAVCVTGLVVESTGGYWSPFGQGVILVLIQLGGLGIMTFGALFALVLWRSLGLRESATLSNVVSGSRHIRVGRIMVFIVLSTAAIEALGVWSLWNLWDEPAMTTGQRLFMSIFHSVSAFCNAGFCIYDRSLELYRDTWQVNVAVTGLIIVGGLGFLVIHNLSRIGRCHVRRLWTRLRGRIPQPELDRRRLSLQTRLVLLTTLILLAAGLGMLMFFETLPNLMDSNSPADARPFMARTEPHCRALYAWFQSVTARTAGFNTVPIGQLTDSSKFLTIVLMFIGASPGSTGGGIKTATLAVVFCGVWSMLRNRQNTHAFKRSIPQNIFLRSLVIITLGGAVVVAATLALSVAHEGMAFLDAMFEATSAFGTVGLSTGVTPQLNHLGRLLIIAVMFIGRVGPLTLFIALPLGAQEVKYEYATENVAIG